MSALYIFNLPHLSCISVYPAVCLSLHPANSVYLLIKNQLGCPVSFVLDHLGPVHKPVTNIAFMDETCNKLP